MSIATTLIPFIPPDNGDDNSKEEQPKTIKVRLPSGADMYYLIFENGTTEDLIKHIFLHKSIVLALNLPNKIDTLTRERNGRNAALHLMDADDERGMTKWPKLLQS